MNINKIFNLFNSSDNTNETEVSASQMDLSDSPIIWIGMFKRMIVNYETFAKQLIQFFGTANPSLDIEDIEKVSSYMVYDKAYSHLSKLDLTNHTHLDSLKLLADETFLKVLDSALTFFEKAEEYEKCSFLMKVKDIVNSFQK